tara:strand:+ start:387 stop:827 length:441 start_codon:yes stop_codon:yes gene_type:complete
MTLLKWSPRPMNTSNEFDDMVRTLFHLDWESPLNKKTDWEPKIDIKESDTSFLIKADIAGLSKKDIKITIIGDQLTISGERKENLRNEDSYYHFRERSNGKFCRSFNLPESVNKDKINAQFKNGTLSIDLEKHEEILPKEKEILIK